MTDQEFITTDSLAGLREYGITDIAVAIGVFDGVHSGHRKLLATLLEMAHELGVTPVVMSFWPHPRKVIDPQNAPAWLVSLERKEELLAAAGIRVMVNIPFTRAFSECSPDSFLESCLNAPGIKLHGICVGKKWRFGAKGAGNVSLLDAKAKARGFRFIAVDELSIDGIKVSSTSVREALSEGNIGLVTRLLGRRYTLYGVIVRGVGIAGTRLSCPTANLHLDSGLIPRFGVYAGFAAYDGVVHPAIANIGKSPTFNGHRMDHARVEVHILDECADLYGKTLSFELAAFLREERKFDSPEALKMQIMEDVKQAAAVLKWKEEDHL